MKRESALIRLRRNIAARIGVVCALCFAVSCLAFPAVSQALEENAAPASVQYSNTRAMEPINKTKYFIQFVDIESRQILFVNSVERGGSIYAPLPKSRPGYTFIGWKAPSGEVYRPGDMIRNITSAMVFSAVWEKTVYTVTYQWKGRAPAGVLLPESSSVYWGESPQLDAVFNEGYAVQDTMVDALGNSHTGVWFFTGWHAIQGLDEQGHAIGNVVYEGEWSFGATDDTASSSGDRSAGSDSSNTTAGDTNDPSDPNLPSGDDSDKPPVDIDPNPDTGIGDVDTIMHVITLHMSVDETRSVLAQEGKPFQLPMLADTASEHFVGWRAVGDSSTYTSVYSDVREDTVFDPIWELRKFTLQYQWHNGAPQNIALPENKQNITYGETVNLPQMPLLGYRELGTLNGQTGTWAFNGWHVVSGVSTDNTVISNVIIEGMWDFEADEPTPVDPDPLPVDPEPEVPVDTDLEEPTRNPEITNPVTEPKPQPNVQPVQPTHGGGSVVLPQEGDHTAVNNSGQEKGTSSEQNQGSNTQKAHTQRTNLASRQASNEKTMRTWRDVLSGSENTANHENRSNTNTKVPQHWLTQSDLGSPTQSDSVQQSHSQEPLVLDSALAHDTKPRYEVNINPDIDEENDTAQVSEFHRATQNASFIAVAAGVVAVGAGSVALFSGIRRRFFPSIKHN